MNFASGFPEAKFFWPEASKHPGLWDLSSGMLKLDMERRRCAMKTVSCIPHGEPDRTPGDAGLRTRGRGRRLVGDKVVDLAAWRAEHLVELDGSQDERMSAPEPYGDRRPVRRRRRSPSALDRAELAATLAVIAVFAARFARVLLF